MNCRAWLAFVMVLFVISTLGTLLEHNGFEFASGVIYLTVAALCLVGAALVIVEAVRKGGGG